MSVTTAHADQAAPSLRALLPVWVGAAIYALFVLAGNRLLLDPDTLWQITVGQWIIDHRAVPTEEAKPGLDDLHLKQPRRDGRKLQVHAHRSADGGEHRVPVREAERGA